MRFLLLLVAAVVAIFAGVAALQFSGGGKTEGTPAGAPQAAATAPSNVLTVDVLVARQPIPAGTLITPAMIDRQPWPENLVLDGFITGATADTAVLGKVTRSPFQAREPLIASKLADTHDSGFLAAGLPEGMRAITIATDAISGVAGYVFPGDRIDLVFTHNIPDKGKGSTGSSTAPMFSIPGLPALPSASSASAEGAGYAEVLASNVPVLAVNIRTSAAPEGAANPAEALVSNLAGGGTTTPSSMTLQVTDMQAQKIRLAERSGNITVSLRSLKDRNNTTVPPAADLASLTQVTLSPAVQQEIQTHNEEVKVIRGVSAALPSAPSASPFSLYTPPVAR